MGKFSDYVGAIKNQTDDLRNVVSAKSGVDCNNYSIGECASVVDSLEVTSQEELGYKRPSWYPDIEDIVMKAPDIVKDGVTYYPIYSMLLSDLEDVSPFYQANSTSQSAINYYRGTGGEAFIFSDDVDNDIVNANENTLQVGTTIMHSWDKSKDIGNGEDGYRVRWVVVYVKNLTITQNPVNRGSCPVIEAVIRQGTYSGGSYFWGGSSHIPLVDMLKYFKICKDFICNVASLYFLYNSTNLEELVCENNQLFWTKFSGMPCLKIIKCADNIKCGEFNDIGLKTLHLKGSFGNDGVNSTTLNNLYGVEKLIIDMSNANFNQMSNLNNLKHLELKDVVTLNCNSSILSGSKKLKYVKFPSTLKSITMTTNSFFPYVEYFEMFNDFDISGLNFTGLRTKQGKWFKDLCIWLKDRTGDTANTMIIGTNNLTIANNIYLTFNPNNKRDITFDGVTAETDGAMSITEFISSQLNWTLS